MQKELIIKPDELGEFYAKAFSKILAIRKQRRSLYGDSYEEAPSICHYWHAFNKLKRLQTQLKIEQENGKENTNYEKIEDNAIDIINYMIFFLALREKEAKNE
jgi:hypothetical protein